MSQYLKPVEWVGSSLEDLKDFPEEVRQAVGYALYLAQCGEKHPSAKPIKGFKGAGVLEVVEDFDTDTYRAIYTLKLAGVVYVLHAFQKKSKQRNRVSVSTLIGGSIPNRNPVFISS
jgi:phage-related protein